MDKEKKLLRLEEGMELVSLRLAELHNLIIAVYMGLQSEHVEKQALDSLDCISFCLNDIDNFVQTRLSEVQSDRTGNNQPTTYE
jgi:hypothetical protein